MDHCIKCDTLHHLIQDGPCEVMETELFPGQSCSDVLDEVFNPTLQTLEWYCLECEDGYTPSHNRKECLCM